MALISVDELKRFANIDHNADDTLCGELCDMVSATITDFLKQPGLADGSPTIPLVVKIAVLNAAAESYRNREKPDLLSDNVRAILMRQRDPALA